MAMVNTLKAARFRTKQVEGLQIRWFKTYISDRSLTLSIFHDLQTKVKFTSKVNALKTALFCTNQAKALQIRWFKTYFSDQSLTLSHFHDLQ